MPLFHRIRQRDTADSFFFYSRKRCHSALKLLNTLIPGFEQKAAAADNTSYYCAPVSLTDLLGFLRN